MAITIKCPQCGFENQLGRIFCHHCGSKLEFSEGSFKEGTPVVSKGQLAGRLIRLAITLGLVAILVLMLMPANPAGQTGSRQDSVLLDQKIRVLRRAALDGRSLRQEVREEELNAYIEEFRAHNGQPLMSVSRFKMDLSKINFTLLDNRVDLLIEGRAGPVALTLEVGGQPTRDQGHFNFVAKHGRIGHLPLPGPAAGWLAGRMSVVFSKMDREKQLLDDVKQIDVQSGTAVIQTGR